MDSLLSLSTDMARAVESVGHAVVAVNARRRLPSTGVLWRPGVIVTAHHALEIDEEITVTTPAGHTVPVALAGRDAGTDLAVLRIPGDDIPAPAIGDSGALRTGHLVLAIGYGPRASWGIISALGGRWQTWRGGEIDRLVRLDLILYPGFSGGPLVDPQGQVVGINTSGLSHHMALSIPASTVSRVTEELLAKGRIARAYLGLGMQPVRLPEAFRTTSLPSDTGLIVVHVRPEGPAASAGILIGDIVVALDAAPVGSTDDVQAFLATRAVGSAVQASIIRAGAPTATTITLGERPR